MEQNTSAQSVRGVTATTKQQWRNPNYLALAYRDSDGRSAMATIPPRMVWRVGRAAAAGLAAYYALRAMKAGQNSAKAAAWLLVAILLMA